jgi:hypothetical protein
LAALFLSEAGYSIEVWKAAVVRVGLKPADYQFVCMEFDDLEKGLTDPSGICDVAGEDLAVGRAQISIPSLGDMFSPLWTLPLQL